MRLFELAKATLIKLRLTHIFLLQIKKNRIIVRDGIKYRVDLSRVIDMEICLGGWEPMTIKFLKRALGQGDVVIEAGANIGAHSLFIAKLVLPDGHCYAFEPTEYVYNKLLANSSLNNFDGLLTSEKYMLTNHELETPIIDIESSWEIGKELCDSEKVSGGASAISIDSYVVKKGINRVDLLKIDVDGYDYKVLCGAKKTIEMYRPKIFIELADFTLKRQGDSVGFILSFMKDLNYQGYYVREGTKICDYEEVLSKSGPTSHVDAIFLPEEMVFDEKERLIGKKL